MMKRFNMNARWLQQHMAAKGHAINESEAQALWLAGMLARADSIVGFDEGLKAKGRAVMQKLAAHETSPR